MRTTRQKGQEMSILNIPLPLQMSPFVRQMTRVLYREPDSL